MYLCINLGPAWQVENVYKGTYIVLSETDYEGKSVYTVEKQLVMKLPAYMKERGDASCEDIVKVFVTSRPAPLRLLELPRLGEENKVVDTYRGSQEGSESAGFWTAISFSNLTISHDL